MKRILHNFAKCSKTLDRAATRNIVRKLFRKRTIQQFFGKNKTEDSIQKRIFHFCVLLILFLLDRNFSGGLDWCFRCDWRRTRLYSNRMGTEYNGRLSTCECLHNESEPHDATCSHIEKVMKSLIEQLSWSQLPSKDDPVKRPVLVFFHPGAFYLFSGQSHNFGPQYLLDKDIVLVTVNYRLASLGKVSCFITFSIIRTTSDNISWNLKFKGEYWFIKLSRNRTASEMHRPDYRRAIGNIFRNRDAQKRTWV